MIDPGCQREALPKADRQEEGDLADRFRRGDVQAFEQIIERHGEAISQLASRLLGWQDGGDLVQDVFAAAWTNRKKFRADCSVKSWLYTLTLNRCKSLWRRQRLWGRFFARQTEQAAEAYTPRPAGPDFEPVRKAVQALPDQYRRPVVLKYLEELETEEIMSLLKISRSALNTRLSRGRQLMKEALKDWNQKP